MTTLTEFLLARIAEDEAVARSATVGPWTQDGSYVRGDGDSLFGTDYYSASADHEPDAAHITRHDPARVLAECEAHRRIVERAQRASQAFDQIINPTTSGVAMTMDLVLADLASIYADHEDFDESWRP